MTSMPVPPGRRRSAVRVLLLTLGIAGLFPTGAVAQETVVDGLSWMTQFPATWNAGAPKLVSDGLHYYAVICGFATSSSTCTVARKRGDFGAWTFASGRTFLSFQPATVILDRKGRLNIFYNDPQVHHVRFDHPSVNLSDWVEIPVGFSAPTGYLQASYDAKDDIIMLAFNETASWTLYFGVKFTDANGWMLTAMPASAPGTILLYARALRAGGRYVVLAGEHTFAGPNFAYTAAVLFEATTATGPWSARDLYRVTGTNLGVPYQNWVLANDLQADRNGRVRALLHITENGSGHGGALDGLYVAREEDGYVPRFVASGIEDGFTLYVDPSGVHYAFARVPIQVSPFVSFGGIVWFQSNDGGASWFRPTPGGYPDRPIPHWSNRGAARCSAPASGSSLRARTLQPVHMTACSSTVSLSASAAVPTATDYEYRDDDGTLDYIRAYRDIAGNRFYYYIVDYDPDFSYSVNYSYTAGDYYQVYISDSDGSYRYYNSDGYQITYSAPSIVQYLVRRP